MRSGWSSDSIFWVLLAWGRFGVTKAIIPDGQEHFLTPSARPYTRLFGGLGVRDTDREASVTIDWLSAGSGKRSNGRLTVAKAVRGEMVRAAGAKDARKST